MRHSADYNRLPSDAAQLLNTAWSDKGDCKIFISCRLQTPQVYCATAVRAGANLQGNPQRRFSCTSSSKAEGAIQ